MDILNFISWIKSGNYRATLPTDVTNLLAIGAKDPEKYFAEILSQIETGKSRYGGIKDKAELHSNFEENCIPLAMLKAGVLPYEDFLKERRKLMAQKMKKYFQSLGEIQMESE